MNGDLNLYYTFYVVAKYQNITKASQELYVSQPSVTQAIHTLEKQIGATLFIRTKKGVVLTEEAKVLFKFVQEGITYIKNGEKKFQELMNLEEGTLKIGASTTVTQHVLLPYLKEFQNKYPNISISITNHLTTDLIKLLRNGSVDLLILNLPMKGQSDLEIKPFLTVHDILVVGDKYKELTTEKHIFSELLDKEFIFQKLPSNTRSFLNQWLVSEKIEIEPKFEVVSFNLVKDMTKIGMGIGYVTREFVADELFKKELYELEVSPSIPAREIGIVTLNKNIPSFAARAFIELIECSLANK